MSNRGSNTTTEESSITVTLNALPAINLRCRSSFSLMSSVIIAKKLPSFAAKADQPAVGLIDRRSLSGAYDFATAARKEGVQPVIGCDFDTPEGVVTLISESAAGWTSMLAITRRQALTPQKVIDLEEILTRSEGLIMLAGGPASALSQLVAQDKTEANAWLKRCMPAFQDRLFIEVSRTEGRRASEEILDRISRAYGLPMVGTSPVAYKGDGDYERLELLHAIDQKRLIDDSALIRPEGGQHFKTSEQLREIFADAPHLLENAARLALRCSDDAAPKGVKPMLPRYPDAGGDEEGMLRRMAAEGYEARIADIPEEQKPRYRDRLALEMDIICKQGFAGYFLIVADFIRWSKENGIPVGPGRGSGAGSAVAWAVGITDLDPLRWGLLFERFINPDRVSLPDFDVDFCQSRREEVVEYVRNKYGEDKVVAIGTHGSWGARMAFKDAARSLGIPNGQAHAASEMLSHKFPYSLSQTDETADDYLPPEVRAHFRRDPALDRALVMGEALQGFVRQHGRHAAGIIIADPDVGDVVPVMRDPGGGDDLVTQYDMKGVESCGLVKFDFLGLKTTTIIDEAVKHIRASDPELADLDILKIPFEDDEVFEMLNKGDCYGIFQLESEGMVKALKQVRPTNFEDITAIISLYRPGPMENIPAYANRKNGAEPIQVPHPKLKRLLQETQGIIVYQEQVMMAAQLLAGYSLGGADLLRRAMGKKIQAEMDAQRQTFVEGCATASRIDEKRANELFDIIDRFAGYGFNKSHAAAYALLTWQSSWLKLHHPAAFYSAALTYNDADFDKMRRIIREARDRGVEFLPPDLDKSDVNFTPETTEDGKPAVRWGLGSIKGVGVFAKPLAKACRGKGFKRIEDVARQLSAYGGSTGPVRALAAAGALDSLNKNRQAAAEHFIQCLKFESSQSGQDLLFALVSPSCPDVPDLNSDEKRANEILAIGISFHEHPLANVQSEMRRLSAQPIAKIDDYVGCGAITVLARVESTSKSPRGSTSYARISDTTAEIEVVVEDVVPVGELIVAEIAKKNSEPRWRLVRFRRFSRSATPKRMRIEIKGSHDWEALRRIMIAPGRGEDRIDVMVDLGDKKARRVIPPCFVVTAELEKALAAHPDVLSTRML
jgi:DNA polymerase-3 subunit alpha